ncbi:hypothetical protein AAG906_011840 [Vitis piasezkii]
MKEEQQHLHHHHHQQRKIITAKKLTRPTAYFLLLLLSAHRIGQRPLWCHEEVWRPSSSKLVRQTILNRVFSGTSPFTRSAAAPPPQAEENQGWASNGAVLENLIRRVKPRTIIEVGTFLGASAIHMARLGPTGPDTISPRTYGPCRAISFPCMGRPGLAHFLSGPC